LMLSFLYCSLPLRYLHSFPTRRSSDLLSRIRKRCFGAKHRQSVHPDGALAQAASRRKHARCACRSRSFAPRRNAMNLVTFEINRSEEHTSELQSRSDLVCRLLLEKKKK